MNASPSIGEFEIAQARGAVYGLISHGFQYPNRELINTLTDPACWSSWPHVLLSVDIAGARQLETVRAALQAEAAGLGEDSDAEPTKLQDTFDDLFGHAVRGKAPPYELEYGRSEIIQQASHLADVAGFYAAFGMEVDHRANDRGDHIAVECEFMNVLCAKEARALEKGEADHLGICVDAQHDFLKDHLARWVPAFAHRIQQANPQGFYGALAAFTKAFVAGECRRFEIRMGPPTLELRSVDPVLDRSISCGPTVVQPNRTEEELVQLSVLGGRDGEDERA